MFELLDSIKKVSFEFSVKWGCRWRFACYCWGYGILRFLLDRGYRVRKKVFLGWNFEVYECLREIDKVGEWIFSFIRIRGERREGKFL